MYYKIITTLGFLEFVEQYFVLQVNKNLLSRNYLENPVFSKEHNEFLLSYILTKLCFTIELKQKEILKTLFITFCSFVY